MKAESPADRVHFEDRRDAGRQLAQLFKGWNARSDAIVLGLPRGGVPVAYEVAAALGLPLDVWIVRKLGVPGREELAMGAIASGGVRVLNELVVQAVPNAEEALARIAEREGVELHRREVLYRQGRPAPALAEKTVILVDDGLATGATMRAAVRSLRAHRAAHIIVAAPVGSADSRATLATEADEVVCLATPEPFFSVGEFYDDFEQTSDAEVEQLLAEAAQRPPNQTL